MILFKCSCGIGLKVTDDQGGQRFLCPACMQEITAPTESQPECVLIYQEGGPADGFVIDSHDLEDKITNRELGPWDLIWQEENWVPLGHVYEFPEEPAPPEDDSCMEIALQLSELPPIDGYASLPKQGGKSSSSRSRSSGCGGPGWAESFREKSLGGKLFFLVKLLLVLGILGFGLYRTVKMVNSLKNPSSGIGILHQVVRAVLGEKMA